MSPLDNAQGGRDPMQIDLTAAARADSKSTVEWLTEGPTGSH
jgi:hypothetical protein